MYDTNNKVVDKDILEHKRVYDDNLDVSVGEFSTSQVTKDTKKYMFKGKKRKKHGKHFTYM